jgi:hypothetical protein
MNKWKLAVFALAGLLAGSLYSGRTVIAQAHRKAHITAIPVQGMQDNVPYIIDIDGKDVDLPPGQDVKGFSCVPAAATNFNGREKTVPQCYIVSQ